MGARTKIFQGGEELEVGLKGDDNHLFNTRSRCHKQILEKQSYAEIKYFNWLKLVG